jgi:hypothetical protein
MGWVNPSAGPGPRAMSSLRDRLLFGQNISRLATPNTGSDSRSFGAPILENFLRHIDYAVNCIQRALARVENDRLSPAILSPEITDYLIDLTIQHRDDGPEFSKFVMLLPFDAMQNAILNQLLPQAILDYRAEHEQLQMKKENRVSEYDFEGARDCLDQQNRIRQSISGALAGQQLVVTPKLIDSALRSLGYNG